jgi:hypothetical protein
MKDIKDIRDLNSSLESRLASSVESTESIIISLTEKVTSVEKSSQSDVPVISVAPKNNETTNKLNISIPGSTESKTVHNFNDNNSNHPINNRSSNTAKPVVTLSADPRILRSNIIMQDLTHVPYSQHRHQQHIYLVHHGKNYSMLPNFNQFVVIPGNRRNSSIPKFVNKK